MKTTIVATLALIASAGLSWAGAAEGKEVYAAMAEDASLEPIARDLQLAAAGSEAP